MRRLNLRFVFGPIGMLSTALILIAGFQNCSKTDFATTGPSTLNLGPTDNVLGVTTQTGGPNCRNQLQTITAPVKLVFIVDVSGSNTGKDGTDPKRIVRGDSIERFYNTYSSKLNFGWSLSTFSNSSAKVLLKMGDAPSMASAIVTFRSMSDDGYTPYEAALNAAHDNIASDSGRAAGTKYVVVFISDGDPNPDVSNSKLNTHVTDIINTVPGAVSFNTIYYGQYSKSASDRLKMMAQTGGGNFLDTNANPTGTDFLITDLVLIPGVVCN